LHQELNVSNSPPTLGVWLKLSDKEQVQISRDHYDDELVAEAALRAYVVRIIAGKVMGRINSVQEGLDEVKGGKAGYVKLSKLDLHETEYAMIIVLVEAKGLKTQTYPQLQARILHRVR
jgi:hypothetical protein